MFIFLFSFSSSCFNFYSYFFFFPTSVPSFCVPSPYSCFFSSSLSSYIFALFQASVLRTLRESADGQLDRPYQPLHDWECISSRAVLNPRLQRWARHLQGVPFAASLLNHLVYVHLAFVVEVCVHCPL